MKFTEGAWEKVTPKKAEVMLGANRVNRKLRVGVVDKYAKDEAYPLV